MGFKMLHGLEIAVVAATAAGVALAAVPASAPCPQQAQRVPMPTGHDTAPLWVCMGQINVISLADLPAPRRAEIAAEMSRNGPSPVSDRDGLWAEPLPPLVAEVGQGSPGRLAFTPLDLGGLVLADLQPLGAAQMADAHQGEAILSAVRYWRRTDGAALSLQENALTPNNAVVVVRELRNASVAQRPAQLLVQCAPSGRVRSVVLWDSPRASYTLTVDDDVDHPAQPRWNRDWLLGVAQRLAAREAPPGPD